MRMDLLQEDSTSHSGMVKHGIAPRMQVVLMLRRINGQKSNVIIFRENLITKFHSVPQKIPCFLKQAG